MISQDTKDQIDKVGKQHARAMYPGGDRLNHGRIAFAEGYSEGAYEYAEKLEEKDKAYNELGVKFDKEIERWQERDADELEKLLALQTELAQLKEIAETMAKALEAQPNMYDSAIFAKRVALTGYAEWCKQNLK